MKGILRSVCVLLFVPLLAWMPVSAQEIDLNQPGSLTISFNNQYPLQGSSYAIWQVAVIGTARDGSFEYQNAPGFEGIRFHFTEQDLDYWDTDDSRPLIEFVGDFVDQEHLKPYATGTIGESNTLTFPDLPLGIYYVRQTDPGEAGYVMTSYLATIPDDDGSYDAATYGKTDPFKNEEPKTPDVPKTPDSPQTPETPGKESASGTHTAAKMQQEKFLILAGVSLCVLSILFLARRRRAV